jgi:hypothetical protein
VARRRGGLASVLLIALLVLAVAGCGGGGTSTKESGPTCNGSASLCGKRLDQVVFPGTHNSYAASDEPGWHFAGQRFGIPRQLGDGIRALLLDVHFGVPAGNGLVRTDFAAEGADANKGRGGDAAAGAAAGRTDRRAARGGDAGG